MCFFTGEKNADVFFESKPKTRMCLEFKIKNAYVFLDGRKKRGCVLEVGLKNAYVFFSDKETKPCMFFPARLYVILAWLPVLAVEFLALSIAVVRCAVSSGYCKWIPHLFRQVRLWKIAK